MPLMGDVVAHAAEKVRFGHVGPAGLLVHGGQGGADILVFLSQHHILLA